MSQSASARVSPVGRQHRDTGVSCAVLRSCWRLCLGGVFHGLSLLDRYRTSSMRGLNPVGANLPICPWFQSRRSVQFVRSLGTERTGAEGHRAQAAQVSQCDCQSWQCQRSLLAVLFVGRLLVASHGSVRHDGWSMDHHSPVPQHCRPTNAVALGHRTPPSCKPLLLVRPCVFTSVSPCGLEWECPKAGVGRCVFIHRSPAACTI